MPRLKAKPLALSLGLVVGGTGLVPLPALAQAPRGKPMLDEVIAKGGNNTCDEMSWNARRDDQGTIRGVIWYTGGAGVSNAVGKVEPDGHFTIKVASIYGAGPVGTVTGVRNKDGSLDVQFTGTSCKTGMVHIPPGATSTGN